MRLPVSLGQDVLLDGLDSPSLRLSVFLLQVLVVGRAAQTAERLCFS